MLYRALLCAAILLPPYLLAGTGLESDYSPKLTPPKAGPVQLFPEDQVKRGMKGIAWTVFQGSTPEAVPVEILGVARSMWGPREDIIIAKLTGPATRTNVAGGMSGSPVYIDGKLVGAISLRLSVFSPDAICGITPIGLMLEVNDFDKSRPSDSRTPGDILTPTGAAARASMPSLFPAGLVPEGSGMTPIATPITMSGFTEEAVKAFAPVFQQLGMPVSQGGGAGGSTIGGALSIRPNP